MSLPLTSVMDNLLGKSLRDLLYHSKCTDMHACRHTCSTYTHTHTLLASPFLSQHQPEGEAWPAGGHCGPGWGRQVIPPQCHARGDGESPGECVCQGKKGRGGEGRGGGGEI